MRKTLRICLHSVLSVCLQFFFIHSFIFQAQNSFVVVVFNCSDLLLLSQGNINYDVDQEGGKGRRAFLPISRIFHLFIVITFGCLWIQGPLFFLLSSSVSKSFQSTIHLLSISCVLLLFLFSSLHWCGDCSNFSGDFSASTGGSSSFQMFPSPQFPCPHLFI